MDNNDEYTDAGLQFLMIRYLDGEASETEILALQEWLGESGQHQAEFEQLRQDWLCAGYVQRYATDKAWQKIERRLLRRLTEKRRRLWMRAVGYAAVIAVLFGVGYYSVGYYRQHEHLEKIAGNIEPGSHKAVLILGSNEEVVLSNEEDKTLQGKTSVVKKEGNTLIYDKSGDILREQVVYNRLITPRGGEYSVVLSDGTKVWLNAESELKYPVHFAGKEREVYLKGEAYFSVTKQNEQPFVVYVGDSRITVLGTEFNVRSYQDEEIAATLVKGAVRIHDVGRECDLTPGMQAVIEKDEIRVREVDTDLYTAWKDGYFIYREKTLEDIMKELSRWYDFTYDCRSEELRRMTLTAKLRKFDRVEDIFDILKRTGRLDFAIQGKNVTVLAK